MRPLAAKRLIGQHTRAKPIGMAGTIYKIATDEEWQQTRRDGTFPGAPVDLADGFIHLSTASQVRETAARHFAGREGLVLLCVDEAKLGDALRYEPSRGGDLFPHLYGTLELAAIDRHHELPLADDGSHRFPDGLAG